MTLDAKWLQNNKKFSVLMSATLLSLSVASITSGCSTIEKNNNHGVNSHLLNGSASNHGVSARVDSGSKSSFLIDNQKSDFAKLYDLQFGEEDARLSLMSSIDDKEPFISPLGFSRHAGQKKSDGSSKVNALDSFKFAKLLSIAYKIPDKKADNFADWILEATSDVDVPEELLAGVIMAESTFDYYVVSSAGAVGPGQLKPQYWKDICPKIKDPKHNVKCAATVLYHYYDDYCDKKWNCAIRTYNVGPGNMKSKKFAKASNVYLNKVNNHTKQLVNVKKTTQGRIITMLSVPSMLNKKGISKK